MAINKKKISIQIFALIGLALAIKLAFIYYSANYDKYALLSFCSINDFIDCDGAAQTDVSQFLGIPLAYWGMFFYLIILFLSIVDRFKNIKILKFLEVFKDPIAYISTLATIAFFISVVLACVSVFGIHKLCILCCVTYLVDLIIALIAADGMFKNIVKNFKTTISDFIEGAKKYTKTFITLLVIFLAFLAYSGITLNFIPHYKAKMSIRKYQKIQYNPYRVKGNELGAKDADIVIELYSDYVCPLCYINNIMLHQAVKEFKNVKVIHHNYPFDKACNPHININMHPYACYMWKGAIAARNQGNYWEMSSLLYENQPKNEEDMQKLAGKLDFDMKKFKQDFNSQKTLDEINAEVERAVEIGIDATPTMYINDEKFVGVKPYYKLKEILISKGAKHK